MRRRTQCPNCIGYKVLCVRRSHYAILFGICAVIAGLSGAYLLIQSDDKPIAIVAVWGVLAFSVISVFFLVKVIIYRKADALCMSCWYRFQAKG